jgi:hypothetical protein
MEQILVGNEGKVERIDITPEFSELLEPSLLANMAIFNPEALILLVLTSKSKEERENSYSFEDLFQLLRNEGGIEDNTKLEVEKSLDILLDSGFFSAEWKLKNDQWERLFYNRNEVGKYLSIIREDFVKSGDGFRERFERICGRLLLADS